VCKNVFARGLKRPVSPAADLADQVAVQLRKTALGRLGLARKAGAVVTGFAKVEATLAAKDVAALVIAVEAAEDGRRKIEQALRRRFGEGDWPPVFRCFASAELDLATGGAHVIHAAVLHGPAGRGFVEAADRLRRYQGAGGGEVGIDAAAQLRDMTDE
jgi:hypothetical protein